MRHSISALVLAGLVVLFCQTASSLEYIESSGGLSYPQLDGGRTELEFADIDADGDVDLLSIGDHGSPYINTNEHGIMVWFGDGAGSWSVYQNGDFGYGGIAVGDVNNDGLLDVGYAMHHDYSSTDFGDQLIEVALGDGTGQNWTPWDDGLATNGESWGMFGTDFADVDSDGDLDVGSNSFGCCSGVHVYLNQFDGSWTQSFGFLGGNSNMDLMFGDIDGDGKVDMAARNQEGTIYFGDGDGGFVHDDGNLPSSSWYGTSLGDVDNDGGLDIAFIDSYSGPVEVWVYDETLELWSNFSGNLPASGSYESTQLWDMNLDGYVDVVAFGDAVLTVWLGDGAGNWAEAATFTTPPYGNCEALRVGGDVDHNGYPDIALVSEQGSWPSYRNHLHCYKEASPPESLTIYPVFPRGSETLTEGSVQFVDWASAVPVGEQSLVELEYSHSGPGGPWMTIAEDLPNNGRYQWIMPAAASSDCYMRYTVSTGRETKTAITPRPFSIVGGGTGVSDAARVSGGIRVGSHPNPFSSETSISFSAPDGTRVSVELYNAAGQRVRTLATGYLGRGSHTVNWDGTDDRGRGVGSGIYFCQVRTGAGAAVRKLLLMR